MSNKVLVFGIFVIALVGLVLASILIYQKRNSPQVVTPSQKIMTDRGADYPLGVNDVIGGFVEFSGTITGKDLNAKTITMNVSFDGKPYNIQFFFLSSDKQALLYKMTDGKLQNHQEWRIVAIDDLLNSLSLDNQGLLYLKDSKQDVKQLLLSQKGAYRLGPIEKLALYEK